jgi:hypothetical protein
VRGILYREIFRLRILLEYIDSDQDNRFYGVFWKGPNKLAGKKLNLSSWFPLDDGIPWTWVIFTPMVTSMAPQQVVGIGSIGIPIWWWDSRIHLSDRLI